MDKRSLYRMDKRNAFIQTLDYIQPLADQSCYVLRTPTPLEM